MNHTCFYYNNFSNHSLATRPETEKWRETDKRILYETVKYHWWRGVWHTPLELVATFPQFVQCEGWKDRKT